MKTRVMFCMCIWLIALSAIVANAAVMLSDVEMKGITAGCGKRECVKGYICHVSGTPKCDGTNNGAQCTICANCYVGGYCIPQFNYSCQDTGGGQTSCTDTQKSCGGSVAPGECVTTSLRGPQCISGFQYQTQDCGTGTGCHY